ncbi:uncharacterized protein LOC143617953 [Bidens hawaiensis]|uniref:uncharacterized protein LOC143617953 n=1 Tax=Bidens hawaiensis TaxID=980011 RepID=UPI004049BFAE
MLKYFTATSNSKLLFNISSEWLPPFQLKVVRLGSCKIDGGFPQWFQTQRKLEELVLSNASIVGPLPTWLRLLPNIPIFDLSHNKLTGPLMNLPSVSIKYSEGELYLQDNLFTGFSPRWLCKMTYLKVLDISRNRLNGKIPECVWNLSLTAMLLSSNRLSGVIPSSLGRISSLVWLQLNDNNLKGELPQNLGHFKNLAVLDLGENKISGSIPEWIGENVTRLFAFRLHKNRFIGHIPHSLCKCDYLQVLDLAHNNLTESIPHCFGDLIGMQEFSYDPFSTTDFWYGGDVTQVLKGSELDYTGLLSLLKNMDLSSNKLVGEIPETLTALTTLVGLNLSYNHLIGGIPNKIGSMKSSNEFLKSLEFVTTGKIPTGNQLQTLTDPSVYFYNPYLCGAPLPKKCSSHENPPTTTRYENTKEPNKVLFYSSITCGFATGFWGIIGVLVFKKQWRHKLFMFCEATMDKIYVAVAVKVSKMERGRESA